MSTLHFIEPPTVSPCVPRVLHGERPDSSQEVPLIGMNFDQPAADRIAHQLYEAQFDQTRAFVGILNHGDHMCIAVHVVVARGSSLEPLDQLQTDTCGNELKWSHVYLVGGMYQIHFDERFARFMAARSRCDRLQVGIVGNSPAVGETPAVGWSSEINRVIGNDYCETVAGFLGISGSRILVPCASCIASVRLSRVLSGR